MDTLSFTIIVVCFLIFLAFFIYLIKLSIFGFKDKIKPYIGQKWAYKDTFKEPWFDPNKNDTLVTIIDIRKGYIKFDRSFIKDDVCKLDTFVRLYRYVKD